VAIKLPPIPNSPVDNSFIWRDWFYKVSQALLAAANQSYNGLDFTGSNITSIVTRDHNSLTSKQGGDSSTQFFHVTSGDYTNLTNRTVLVSHTILNNNVTSSIAMSTNYLGFTGTNVSPLTVTLPSSPQDGQLAIIYSQAAVASLTLSSSGTIISAPTSIGAGGVIRYLYNLSTTTWIPA
jgi:hypothetical protein